MPTPPSCSGPAAPDPGQSFCLEHDIWKANKTSVCVWCDWACDSVLWMICTGLVSMMLTDLKPGIRWAELNNVTILFLFKISQIPIKKHVIVHINNSNLCISGECRSAASAVYGRANSHSVANKILVFLMAFGKVYLVQSAALCIVAEGAHGSCSYCLLKRKVNWWMMFFVRYPKVGIF